MRNEHRKDIFGLAPQGSELTILKLNQRYRVNCRRRSRMSGTVRMWQDRALCWVTDLLSLQGRDTTWDSKEATCLFIQSTITFKDHLVLNIKISRVRSCPVPDLQFQPKLIRQTGVAPGKIRTQPQVGRASQRAQELHCLVFVLPTIELDWLSNRTLKILLICDFFFLHLLYGALWDREN